MSGLDLTQQEALEETLARRAAPLDARERRAEALTGGAFVLAVAGLWAISGLGGHWHPAAAAACTVALAIAMRIRFDVAGIYTVPSQLALVPLLFTVPPAAVPILVVIGLVGARLPEVVRGEVPAGRLLCSPANGWFAVGPAAVLVAGGSPTDPTAVPALVALAVVAQIVTDFAASSFREALVRGASLREQLADARWVYSVDAALAPVAYLGAAAVAFSPWAPLALVPLLALLGFFARDRRARLENALELTRAYRGMALVLGDVVEADDAYTGDHCKDVVALAEGVGRWLGLPAERMRNLEFGALLHDVGKITVPKELINKPGRLTEAEFEIVKTHTTEGQRILDRVGGFMREVGVIVRHHHERWDGGGYPDGLAGEAIPLEARIVACCDTFNAITTTRPYRAAAPAHAALEELRRCAGTQFDPLVVDALVETVGAEVPFTATLAPPDGTRPPEGSERAARHAPSLAGAE